MESSPATTSHHHSSRWKRGRCIGRGSFATVHIATHNNHTFAVKSTPLVSSNSTQLNSLNNEIQILETLNNSCPHIIQYLGHDDTPTHRNIHLEYLPNGTVSEQSNTNNTSKTEHVVRCYTRCLLAALAHLHSRNIVHCDVKGRNVLVGTKHGECKLADFGSAFEIRNGENDTEVICRRGSPLWMAPEVLRGEYQGPESDVWSLGCTVIEMLTGKVNSGDTVWQIAFSDKTPEIPSNVSEKGRDFLNKCLKREWKERWSCEKLMKHPFVAEVVGFEPLTCSTPNTSSPRCVLDELDSKFDGFDEAGSDLESGTTSSGLDSSSAIGKLCNGGGPEWEDEGWMTVRRKGMTEYSDSVTVLGGNERMGEVEGSDCNLGFMVSAWLGIGSGVCGYELKDVFGGLLLLRRLLSYVIIMLLLITSLFNNYWRILERLFIIGLAVSCFFVRPKRFEKGNPKYLKSIGIASYRKNSEEQMNVPPNQFVECSYTLSPVTLLAHSIVTLRFVCFTPSILAGQRNPPGIWTLIGYSSWHLKFIFL